MIFPFPFFRGWVDKGASKNRANNNPKKTDRLLLCWINEGGKDDSQFWLQNFCDGFQRTGATGAIITDITLPSYDFQMITFFTLATSIRQSNSNFKKIN